MTFTTLMEWYVEVSTGVGMVALAGAGLGIMTKMFCVGLKMIAEILDGLTSLVKWIAKHVRERADRKYQLRHAELMIELEQLRRANRAVPVIARPIHPKGKE